MVRGRDIDGLVDEEGDQDRGDGAGVCGGGGVDAGGGGRCAALGRVRAVARYGNAMGVVVAIITCFKFMPQVVSSMENKGSGSLSYVTYGVDCCAGVVALLQKLFVTKERVSTWVPPLLLHSMEAYVLGMNYFYDRMKMREARERRERDSEAGGEYGSDDERAQSERLIARAGIEAAIRRLLEPRRHRSQRARRDRGRKFWTCFYDFL